MADIMPKENDMNQLNDDQLVVERDKIFGGCITDLKLTSKVIFPDLYTSPFSPLHDQIYSLIDSGYKKVAIAAPRGIGKTTIAKTLAMQAILFRLVNFVVYVSNSATFAVQQTENIKRELLSNIIIKKNFGSIKDSDVESEIDESFSKDSWTAFGNTYILPRGSGQQVRGLNWKNIYRPQLIIVDDLENKKELKNPQIRKDLKEWFYSDLLKSVNMYTNDWRIVYIDTVKHEDSLLNELLEASDWKSVRLSICDHELKSLAPNYMSDEEIKEEYESLKEKGQLDVFSMELMNESINAETAAFKPEYFKYYEETDDTFLQELKNGEIETVILIDPAKTTNPTSADSAIVVVGVNIRNNKIYVRDIQAGKFHPEEIYDIVFSYAQHYQVRTIGIEMNSLNEFISYPFKTEMLRRGLNYEVIDLKPRKSSSETNDRNYGKEGRIAALIPFYRQGLIYHNKNVSEKLELQLLSFPRSKRLDVMDAFAYIVQLLDMGNRYFMPKYEDPENIEDEYAMLEQYEEPKLEEWRII